MKAAENSKVVKFYNWRDKRNVFTILTVPEHGEDVIKPSSVLSYNKAKKDVDVSDQMSSYYSVLQKSKKWYKKLAFELVCGTPVVNAHALYVKYSSNEKITLRKFTESIIFFIATGKPTEEIRCGKQKVSSISPSP